MDCGKRNHDFGLLKSAVYHLLLAFLVRRYALLVTIKLTAGYELGISEYLLVTVVRKIVVGVMQRRPQGKLVRTIATPLFPSERLHVPPRTCLMVLNLELLGIINLRSQDFASERSPRPQPYMHKWRSRVKCRYMLRDIVTPLMEPLYSSRILLILET